MRDGRLNDTFFLTRGDDRDVIAAWMEDDNIARPHSRLEYATPADFA